MKIEYNIPNYTKAEAYIIIDDFLNNLVSEHSDLVSNPSKTWNASKDKMDFEFEAKGINVSGDIKLLEGKLVLNGDLPWLVERLYGGKIETMIKENLDTLFVKK